MILSEQFPYQDRSSATGGVDLMPDLPMTLHHQNQSLTVTGLVDSGAMISVLPYSHGVQLGFDWKYQTVPISLGGTFGGVDARAIVVRATVGRMPPVRLVFAWTQSDHVPLLLGQFNFFEVFDVVFFRSRRIFEIHVAGSVSTKD